MMVNDFFQGFVGKFEESFKKDDYQYIKSPEAEKSIFDTLFGRLMTTFDLFITKVLREEFGKINPFFEIDPQLASQEVVKQAFEKLGERLENEPSLIPVELINTVISSYGCFIRDFFSDFEKNKEDIERTLFDSHEISEIEKITSASFISYNEGRFSLIVKTDAGKFVYKKHDCRNDVWIHTFLEKYFNGHVYSPKCWADGDRCGFCEFINTVNPSKEEIPEYYRNLGNVAAISRVLGLSDLHCGNVLPVGQVPALVDIEMLFQPLNLNSVDEYLYGKRLDTGYSYYLNRSVLGHSIIESADSPMKKVKDVEFTPQLQKIFLQGFSEGYDKFCQNRDCVINEVKKTYGFQIRRVLREGDYYKHWIKKLYSPEPDGYMQSVHNSSFPHPEVLCKYELAFLKQGNYPYFYTFPLSKDIYGTDGKILIENFFAKSCMDMVYERIELLSEENKAFEIELMKKVFSQDSKPDFSKDIDFVEYWENQLIESPDGQLFWLGSKSLKIKSMDLPFDVQFGTLFIAKRCAEIVASTADDNLKNRAKRLAKIGISCFEQKVYSDRENINEEKFKEGMEAVEFIKTALS